MSIAKGVFSSLTLNSSVYPHEKKHLSLFISS
jgi:hypothetical protein